MPASKYTDSDWKAINEIKGDPTGDFSSPAFFKWAHDFDVIEQVSFRLGYLKMDHISNHLSTLELTNTTQTHKYLTEVERRQTSRSKL